MIRTAIVEDTPEAAERLQQYLKQFEDVTGETFAVALFPEAESFLHLYKPVWDLVFMDIELPRLDGMEAARQLRRLDQKVLLVFVTNMAQYACKGYEVNALDYLVKPVRYTDFEYKLKKAVSLCQNAAESILVVCQKETRRILARDIRFVEVHGHKLTFHTENGEVEGGGTLQEAEEKLKNLGFLRCNKYYLVNYRYVAGIQGNLLQLMGGETLEISRLRKKAFMESLSECMGNDRMIGKR